MTVFIIFVYTNLFFVIQPLIIWVYQSTDMFITNEWIMQKTKILSLITVQNTKNQEHY